MGFGSRSLCSGHQSAGPVGGEQGESGRMEEEFNPRKPFVNDEGSSLNLVLSPPGMLVVIVLLLIAIAVVALWPTH